MLSPKKEILLKNKDIAILRNPEVLDIEDIIKTREKIFSETDFLVRSGTILDKDEERMNTYFKILDQQKDNNILVVCEYKEEIIGTCYLKRYELPRLNHRAKISLSILKKYWNLGIGSEMIKYLIDVSKKLKLTQLELECIEGNYKGLHLYTKYGFKMLGINPKAIKIKDKFKSEYLMVKEL